MRRCGRCQAIPRRDDALHLVQFGSEAIDTGDGSIAVMAGPTVTCEVCRSCRAQLAGLAAPPDPVYPHGKEQAFIVCGICRLALRDNDIGRGMRLHQDDVSQSGVEPGHYWACLECIARFKEKIYQRLSAHPEQYDPHKSGIRLPAFEHFGGDWLT